MCIYVFRKSDYNGVNLYCGASCKDKLAGHINDKDTYNTIQNIKRIKTTMDLFFSTYRLDYDQGQANIEIK